jgi:hypothetical protein
MCPFYTEGATEYDAKSELYSFGIVLLEVLSGKLQGSSGIDGKKLMLHRSIAHLMPDSRAGTWPVECGKRLIELAKQCIAEYEDRMGSFTIVLQRLRQIKADYCPPVTAAESVFQQRMAEIIAKNEELSLVRDVAAAKLVKEIRKCLVCFDDELLLTDGFECSANKHFVCAKNGCFAQIVKDQSGNRARFKASGCKITCTVPDCGETVEDRAVSLYAGSDGFGAFLRAKLAANEEKVVSDYEERLKTVRAQVEQEVLAGLNRQTERLRQRNHIIEELLTIKCPNRRCQLAFIMDAGFDDCFALGCIACGSNFCGWCLRNSGAGDAHEHTTRCRPEQLKPRGLFPQHDNYNGRKYSAKQCFDQVHGPRRAAAVKAYLDAQRLQGAEREAVIKLVEEQWNTAGATLLGDNIALR